MMMSSNRYSRQSFLGPDAQSRIGDTLIGVIGLGGGGSHVVQQLAHLGFQRYALYDPDTVEESNLNRMVGATLDDAQRHLLKTEVARRLILSLQPDAQVICYSCRWQEEPLPLRSCDLIMGCVDGLATRRDLEAVTRRYLIPYIDIGLDVHPAGSEPPVMAGQVVLSMPGDRCMLCMGILHERHLAVEGRRYGVAGPRPQVIWANGVLASTAVGLAIDLLTDWTQQLRGSRYLEYPGNEGIVRPARRMEYAPETCTHYPLSQVGDPML